MESVWLAQPKYLQMVLNPFSSAMLYHIRRATMANSGMQILRRLTTGFWSSLRASARVRRALRSAVSPVVMGAATTPRMARMPPMVPSQAVETLVTTVGAAALSSEPTSAAPPSKKK